jgi:hypothetical protein
MDQTSFNDEAYNLIPPLTVVSGTPTNFNNQQQYSVQIISSCAQDAYPGVSFVACGQVDNPQTLYFSSCCVSSWNQNNKSKCCDPVSNDLTNDSIACDPAFCPFSPDCINDPVTSTYCLANPTDATCRSNCLNFLNNTDNAPTWCTTFIPAYCKAKSDNGQQLSPEDESLCACLMNKTPADECLLDSCVNSPSGSTWLTSKQQKNRSDASYCFQQCKNIAQAVANETAPINSIMFQKVCSEVTLPPSTVPADQLPSNKPPPSDWDFSWNGIQRFFSSISTVEWIVFGVIVFIIIFALCIKRLMKYTGDSTSLATEQ